MTHLFLFTLGPVQSFIAQARKAHDLHSGSKILSELCKVAANYFDTKGGKIIFPDVKSDSIPNRFLGKITCSKDELLIIGKSVSDAVKAEWQKWFEDNFKKILTPSVYHVAEQQIRHHLDIQWLFQTLDDESDETYRLAYDELNKNLNALKNTRPFHVSEEIGRKCSLDGERNVIFYRLTETQEVRKEDKAPLYSNDNQVFDYDDTNSEIKLRHLQPGEGLSAVSMLKRFKGFSFGDFPSTAEFALADSMRAIRQTEEGENAFQEMVKQFKVKKEELNWQVFFEENLNERYFKKQALKGDVNEAKRILKKITDVAKNLEQGRSLEKYYAIVVFDGDDMGEWWKGERLKEGVQLEVFHQNLTTQLAAFAKAVKKEYSKDTHRGWVVYAGGDDFMGFFNLHHLASGLKFLNDKYKELIHDALADQIKGNYNYQLTFTTGVCIAHYKEPLSLVLAHARDLEHKAKKLDGKNALGIGVIPGSGQVAEVVLRSEYFAHLETVISSLNTLDPHLKIPIFSNAFVAKARAELAAFIEKGKDANGKKYQKVADGLTETAQKLLDRAINRSCNLVQNKDEGETDDEFKERKNEKIRPLQEAVSALFRANKSNLSSFFDALDIADFIERQTPITASKSQIIEL